MHGFSAQNGIKTAARSKLSVARLELLVWLSLSYRKYGVAVKIRPRKACNYPNLRSFEWVSCDKVGWRFIFGKFRK